MLNVEELYAMARFALKKWNIIYDEDLVEDLVSDAYLKKDKYDESKGAISTYFIKIMENRIRENDRTKKCKKRDGVVISYDNKMDTDGKEYNILFDDDFDLASDINKKNILEQIIPLVDLPLKLYINGYTQQEIAVKCNTTQATIQKRITANIKELQAFVKKKGLEL